MSKNERAEAIRVLQAMQSDVAVKVRLFADAEKISQSSNPTMMLLALQKLDRQSNALSLAIQALREPKLVK